MNIDTMRTMSGETIPPLLIPIHFLKALTLPASTGTVKILDQEIGYL